MNKDMKHIMIFASLLLLGVACKSAPEKAVDMYIDIEEAAESGDSDEVKELVEDMTIWYEGLSEEDKAKADDRIRRYRQIQKKMAKME